MYRLIQLKKEKITSHQVWLDPGAERMTLGICFVFWFYFLQETRVPALVREDPLEKGMATYSSILAWRIPWTEEPGGQKSMGSQGVRHDWAPNTVAFFPLTSFSDRLFSKPWSRMVSKDWSPIPWLSHSKGKRVSFWSSSKGTTRKFYWFWLARFESWVWCKLLTVTSLRWPHQPILCHWPPSGARGWLIPSELHELMTRREEKGMWTGSSKMIPTPLKPQPFSSVCLPFRLQDMFWTLRTSAGHD